MDEILLFSIVISILVIVLCGLYFAKSKSSQNEKQKTRRRAAIPTRNEDGQIVADQERLVAAGPRGRRGARMQRRPQPTSNVVEEPENDIENDEDEEGNVPKKTEGKIGKKKMEKLQVCSIERKHYSVISQILNNGTTLKINIPILKPIRISLPFHIKQVNFQQKADKKANREAEIQLREEEKKKKELEDAEREKAALKEKEEEERAEEEEKRRKEEKERKEEEEYRKLAASFIVDEEGFGENSCADGGDAENQLQVFIQYIKVYISSSILEMGSPQFSNGGPKVSMGVCMPHHQESSRLVK